MSSQFDGLDYTWRGAVFDAHFFLGRLGPEFIGSWLKARVGKRRECGEGERASCEEEWRAVKVRKRWESKTRRREQDVGLDLLYSARFSIIIRFPWNINKTWLFGLSTSMYLLHVLSVVRNFGWKRATKENKAKGKTFFFSYQLMHILKL